MFRWMAASPLLRKCKVRIVRGSASIQQEMWLEKINVFETDLEIFQSCVANLVTIDGTGNHIKAYFKEKKMCLCDVSSISMYETAHSEWLATDVVPS